MEDRTLNMIVMIAEIILFISLSVLAVYLIISVKKIVASISKIEGEVIQISDNLTPMINDATLILDDVKEIVEKSRTQFYKVEKVTNELVDKAGAVLKIISTVQSTGTNYLNNGINFISAVNKGAKTFIRKFKHPVKSYGYADDL